MIGASGAISGVLGAYLVLYPKAKITVIIPIFYFVQTARLSAVIVLGVWFIIQLVLEIVNLLNALNNLLMRILFGLDI